MAQFVVRAFLLVSLSLGVTLGSAFAFDAKKLPDPLNKGALLIDAGIGFGRVLGGGKMALPPISASIDYVAKPGGIPLTFGLYGGFSREKLELPSVETTYTGIAIAGRVGYHPDFGVKKLDAYVNLALGYYIYNGKSETEIYGGSKVTADVSLSTFYYAFTLGTHYYFGKKVGAFLELGYSPQSFVRAGLAFKTK